MITEKKDNTAPIILIVDDVPENLGVISKILKDRKYKLLFAANGENALEVIKKNPPDLILLDIMMPVLDGYEVLKILKESKDTEDIPVIFLTARSSSEEVVKGFELGAVDYITKPFHAAELLVRVHTHIELQQRRYLQSQLIEELKQSLEEVKKLSGLLPICAYCKKVRDDEGYWKQVEVYISSHSEAEFSHGICPECLKKEFPQYAKDILDKPDE